MTARILKAIAILALAGSLSACAVYPVGGYGYGGYARPYAYGGYPGWRGGYGHGGYGGGWGGGYGHGGYGGWR